MPPSFVNPAKLLQLESAIKNNNFPIIVNGPSGSGKTHAIKETLEKLNMKYLYVDMGCTTIKKPLGSSATVIISNLLAIADLAKIEYKERLILESTMPHMRATEGYTVIKFNRVTQRMMGKKGIRAFNGNLFSLLFNIRQILPDYTMDLYRFLGRIFYGKVDTGEIECANGYLHVCVASKEVGLGNKGKLDRNINKKGAIGKSQILQQSKLRNKLKQQSRTKSIKPSNYKPRSTMIDSSSIGDGGISEINTELVCSFEDDELLIFSDSDELIAKKVENQPMVGNNEQQCRHSVSFNGRKILGYLYENVTGFATVESMALFSDYFSLTDKNDEMLMALIKAIAKKSKPRGVKHSFKSLPSEYRDYV